MLYKLIVVRIPCVTHTLFCYLNMCGCGLYSCSSLNILCNPSAVLPVEEMKRLKCKLCTDSSIGFLYVKTVVQYRIR
jgi:hypothetical protein